MRKILWTLGLTATTVLAFAAQQSGLFYLNSFAKALNGAQHLKADYTVRPVGGLSKNITIELAKPNLAKIESDTNIIVADGKTITTFDKKSKTFLSRPQTEETLAALFEVDDMVLWEGFFNANAYGKVPAAKDAGKRTRRGATYQVVEATMDYDGKRNITFFISPEDNVARQAEVTISAGEDKLITLLDTNSLVLGNDAPDASLFSFKAPEGARQITEAELYADRWYTDLEEAKKVAAQTNRLIFLDFYADW